MCKPVAGMMQGVPKIQIGDVVADESCRDMVAPLGVIYVKGWTRGMAALGIMAVLLQTQNSSRRACFSVHAILRDSLAAGFG